MCDTVVKITLKKEAKVSNCQDFIYWISNNKNVDNVKVEIEENGDMDYELKEEAINQYDVALKSVFA